MNKSEASRLIKEEAARLGFLLCGISHAEFLSIEAKHLEEWLNQGLHGEMAYMENHFELRTDPTKLVPGSQSVISLAYNYYSDEKQSDEASPKISMYAYGRDYHKIVKKKLKELFQFIRSTFGDIHGRFFVDSAPVLERDWAKRSGLGWIGKHTLLLNPKKGSFFFLAEVILDLELEYDQPIDDYCGTCTRCIDACPTDAISNSGYILDASKCISYLTIELKNEIPAAFQNSMENWMFGCDICQAVCPWNRFSEPHEEMQFNPKPELLKKNKKEWEEITEEIFNELFHGSAVKRTKFSGLKRNIEFLKKNHL
jgi:epoxyqueuosine reductase